MEIIVCEDKHDLGRQAAQKGIEKIAEALAARGEANVIVATGASQFEMLQELVKADLDWSRITAFHLDEYVGMPISHPASFRKYLQERFIAQLPQSIQAFHPVNGDAADPQEECARLDALIKAHPIDVAFVGIGENGHLAFNDPPADFEIEDAYLVVDLDEACRRQQMGEGWFATLDDVPRQAISMSIQQILKSKCIIASVPDERKAQAVKDCLQGEVTPQHPSSILQNHAGTFIYLDKASASLLQNPSDV